MVLYANDAQPVICPIRALLRVVGLYKRDIDTSGPLFLSIDASGKVEPSRRLVFTILFSLYFTLLTSLIDSFFS